MSEKNPCPPPLVCISYQGTTLSSNRDHNYIVIGPRRNALERCSQFTCLFFLWSRSWSWSDLWGETRRHRHRRRPSRRGLVRWYGGVVDIFLAKFAWWCGMFQCIWKVPNGRIRRTNIICNDFMYRPLECVRKFKPCGQTDNSAITKTKTQFYKLRNIIQHKTDRQDRQTDRETDKQTDRQTVRETDRQTDRQTTMMP